MDRKDRVLEPELLRQQMEELQTEKDQIATEKEENARILEELKALKAQLESQQGATVAAEEPAEATAVPQSDTTEEA